MKGYLIALLVSALAILKVSGDACFQYTAKRRRQSCWECAMAIDGGKTSTKDKLVSAVANLPIISSKMRGRGNGHCRFVPFHKTGEDGLSHFVGGCCVPPGGKDDFMDQNQACFGDMEAAGAVQYEKKARSKSDCDKFENKGLLKRGDFAIRGESTETRNDQTSSASDLSTKKCEDMIRPMFKNMADAFESAEFAQQGEKTEQQRMKSRAACAALETYEATLDAIMTDALATVSAGSSSRSGLIESDQNINAGIGAMSVGGGHAMGTGGMMGNVKKLAEGVQVADLAAKVTGAGVQTVVQSLHRGLRLMAQKNQREVNNAVSMEQICQEIVCLGGGKELRDVVLTDPCTGTTRATYRVSDECPECGCPISGGCDLKYIVAMCPPLEAIVNNLATTCRGLFKENKDGDRVFDLPSFTRISPTLTTAGRFASDYEKLKSGLKRFLRAEDKMVSSYIAIAREPTDGASAEMLSEGVTDVEALCGRDGHAFFVDTQRRHVRIEKTEDP